MMARSIALCILLAGSSAALGGVEVILSPQTAGPYGPGETVAVDVMLSQDPAGDPHFLRLVQLDFAASDAGLVIVMPVTHAAASVAFWDFNTVPDCIADDADCGAGHFIDDELPGAFPPGPDVISITYVGDLSDPNNPDLNENGNRQWELMGDGTPKKIGVLAVTLPTVAGLPASCTLDVLNAGETDVAFGARIDFGFGEGGRTTWRASAGEITGGTLDLCGGVQVDANLMGSDPAGDESLWRIERNVIELTFDRALPLAPTGGSGEVLIQELVTGAGNFGSDLSSSFTFSVVGAGDVLRIEESAPGVLTHQRWYAVRSTGSWSGVDAFEVHYVNLIGDAFSDNLVNFTDVTRVLNQNGQAVPPAAERNDINGDGLVTFTDVTLTLNRNGTGAPPKPSGH